MAISVKGIASDGRITTGTAIAVSGGVLVPKSNAGVGDLIYKNGTANYAVIGRGTATGSTVTIAGSTYTLWGCIYGFVAGMAMVVAPDAAEVASLQFSTAGSNPSWLTKFYTQVQMHNGYSSSTYAQMNTAQQKYSDLYRGTAGTLVHPTAAYSGGVMTESSFNNNSNNVKRYYGTWTEYLRQMLRVNGAAGTPFEATFDGCKVHEYGRYVTNRIASNSVCPAIKSCYDYQGSLSNDTKGTWWLPSMFELGELMIDEHLTKVNSNTGRISVGASVYRWSSVPASSSAAWVYHFYGTSGTYSYSSSSSMVVTRPVTLLSLA